MITPEQRIERRQVAGASDAPAILGVCPYRTAVDVWLSKTQDIELPQNMAIKLGNALEPMAIAEAEAELGPLIRNVRVVHPTANLVAANLDAQVVETKRPVEAKTHGLAGGWENREAWGSESNPTYPTSVFVQICAQIGCVGIDAGHLVAILGSGIRHYVIEPEPEVVSGVIDAMQAWMIRHVVGGVMPDVTRPVDRALLRAIKRQPGKVVALPIAPLERYRRAVAARKAMAEAWKALEDEVDTARSAIAAAMGDAPFAEFPDGSTAEIKTINKKASAATSYQKTMVKDKGGSGDE